MTRRNLSLSTKRILISENERSSEGKATCKRRDSEGHEATQAKLSDSEFFDKHSEDVCAGEEVVALGKDFAPKPPSLCSSFMDDVCLSPPESHDPLLQKDTSHLMPYSLDQDHGLMKSPLSFDTSSVFGDLTVAGFDNSLYSIPLQKAGFSSIENTLDKKEAFDSSFSPFLEQRDWSLMVAVSPVLPDEISQYKGDAEKSNENKSDFNHVPLSLPEKIMDYGANLNSCASEDELEIKKIVSELENQLQTTKTESPPLLAENTSKHLQMSKFSPLRLSNDSDNDGTGLDIHCPVQSLSVPVSMSSEHFTDQVLPWSSPFQFDLIEEHHNPQTPTHNEPQPLDHFSEQGDDVTDITTSVHSIQHPSASIQNHEHIGEDTNREKEKTAVETKEDILEEKRYTENLMKSLEVISDSIFKEESIISEHQEMIVSPRKSQHDPEFECQATDPIDREDHSEREDITEPDNILSPNIIEEQKQAIEFILNESQSLSLSNTPDPIADGMHPIALQPSDPLENNSNGDKTGDASLQKDITLEGDTMESTYCLVDMGTEGSHVVEGACENSKALDNLNKLFKSNIEDDKHSTIDSQEEEEEAVKEITSDSDAQSPSADGDTELSDDIENVMKTGLLQRSPEFHADSAHLYSPFADEQGVESSENRQEESDIQTTVTKQDDFVGHVAQQNYSHTGMYISAGLAADMSMEVETTEKPYSPILMETNVESQGGNSPAASSTEGESSRLVMLSPSGDVQEPPETCTVNSPKTESDIQSDIIQDQAGEPPTVEDSEEQLPQIHLMASLESLPCSGNTDVEQSQCVLSPAPPASPPLIPISPPTSVKMWECKRIHVNHKANMIA